MRDCGQEILLAVFEFGAASQGSVNGDCPGNNQNEEERTLSNEHADSPATAVDDPFENLGIDRQLGQCDRVARRQIGFGPRLEVDVRIFVTQQIREHLRIGKHDHTPTGYGNGDASDRNRRGVATRDQAMAGGIKIMDRVVSPQALGFQSGLRDAREGRPGGRQ